MQLTFLSKLTRIHIALWSIVYVDYQIILHNIVFLTPQKIKDHDVYRTNYCGNGVRDQQDGPYKMHELDGCVD